MSTRRHRAGAGLLVAALWLPAIALADSPQEDLSTGSEPGVYARVDLGFGTAHLRERVWDSLGLGFSWGGALGWHLSSALALHGSIWGQNLLSHGWGAYVYDHNQIRLDLAAAGVGATFRHEGSRFFASLSVGGALLSTTSDTRPDDARTRRAPGLSTSLRTGFDWHVDDSGPAIGASVGVTYGRPLSDGDEWWEHGFHLDLALTVATR